MAADATREAGSVVPLQLSLSYDHALGDLQVCCGENSASTMVSLR